MQIDELQAIEEKDLTLPENGYKLVADTIRKYFTYYSYYEKTHGYTFDDLAQFGIIGWMKSLDAYDESKGKLSTIAVRYIRTEIYNAIRSTYKGVRVSYEVTRIAKYMRKHRGKKTLEEIQKTFDASDEVMKRALSFMDMTVMSIETTVGNSKEGENLKLIDTLSDESAHHDMELAGLKTGLSQRLAVVSETQRTCIELRLQGYTPTEIGEMLGKSRATISMQIHHGMTKINKVFNHSIENVA
ncbi:sigma-70 family RNA polymerase sigma factor [Bacillus cereus]|uniref:Sigma-70 family RNA polymerase sigma factor n=1 Tax=Bacillus cereus HuA3-9 TaxID=1053205 RepID=R8CIR3_BACCE|nr:sigma-70 family RNA polymerase sigma factor [Bacillus cereus]EOO11395.1 sigma-70 family RNA polymerase sigma factor [Bacillus cereus HuA3-9]